MTHLKVAVRVRPLSCREIEENSSVILSVENKKTIAITNIKVPEQNAGDSRERTRRFTFDFCFHQDASQDDVFEAVENVVSNAVKRRFHSCVLAYGQSASGKTHTMMGFPHDPGLTPRLCQKVFGYLEETVVGEELLKANITVSYLEIYNEKVRDLLSPSQKTPLKIRQHPKKGPYVQGLTEHKASDSITLLQLLESGNSKRRVAATLTNTRSSRSHSVFILNFDSIKLTLVDLAGSERAGNRYSPSRFREGVNINKSLVALGNVISALAEDSPRFSKGIRKRFIPYRDSVLTWLLKDTLGGNSDTVMIATISPSSSCYNETVNTLRFGQRAKLIVSLPVVNEDPREKTIRELRAEIARLKELLKLSQVSPPNPVLKEQNAFEKIIPLMNFTNEEKPVISRLRRTYSVDHPPKKMESARKFGSEEVLKKATPRKGSLEAKSVEAKVDSIRRAPVKPRSQIIASVTHRLYAKTKKKDASTDTSDLPTLQPSRELSICSNARQQLKDLSKRAVRAQRSKETQTDMFPVLRVKEVCTDVDDLKSSLFQVKNAETCTEILTEDKESNCTFLDSLRNAFVVTRSCGTQSTSSVSFTKYLQEPRIEIFNPNTANPIYTNSVNINISHNYLNGARVSGSISEDSLDDQNNVCFPTPDLISNHNSLEPHSSKEPLQIKQASCETITQELEEVSELVLDQVKSSVASSVMTPLCEERGEINIPSVCASQICCTSDNFENYCQYFLPEAPEMATPNIVECKTYSDDCIKLVEPLVLKSIMKHIPESLENFGEPPDSLEYHKKVRFGKGESAQNERMIKAMSEFLEEATILMNNLTMASSRLEEQEYEVQVSINGLEQMRRKRKRKVHKTNIHCQTEEKTLKSDYIQTEDFQVPVNKYELLLEDSCRRLEEKIATAEETLTYNPWDVSVHEDTSLESNTVTFSDYGSLPRRKKRSSCTPSAYLRQLASMRRQVIEASREELSNNSEGSVS